MSNTRWITLVTGLCIALSIAGAEWTTGYSGGGFFWLRAASRTAPSVCLLGLGIFAGIFGRATGPRHELFLLGGVMIAYCLVFQTVAQVTPVENASKFDYPLLSHVQAVLFGYFGYWIGQDQAEITWLFKRIAIACAFASVFAGCLRTAGLGEVPLLAPSWPTRLIILFGYCWYMSQWLNSSEGRFRSFLGVAACSSELWLTLHKPIVVCTAVATLILITLSISMAYRHSFIWKQLAIMVGLVTTALIVWNSVTSGGLWLRIQGILYTRFLHQPELMATGMELQVSDDTVRRAAGGRFLLWAIAIKRFSEHPFTGSGFGQSVSATSVAGNIGDEAVHFHNWYLDYLVSLGILGSLPVFLALLWWLRLATRKFVIKNCGIVVAPPLAYIIGLMTYNLGGSIRLFFSITSFALLMMAIVVAVADRVYVAELARCRASGLNRQRTRRQREAPLSRRRARSVLHRQRI